MCDCVKNIEKRIFEQVKNKKFNHKPVIRANFLDRALMLSGGCAKTYSRIGLELKGQKKKHEVNMIHTYCPFCGEKFPEEKE